MKLFRSLLPFVLLLAAAGAHAQVYQCTDENGHKTYAKDCPTKSVKEKELTNPGVPSAGQAIVNDKLRQANSAFEKRRAERLKAQDQGEAVDRSGKVCSDAKARLASLQSGRPSKRVDPATGDHLPDDASYQAQIDELNSQIADNCK